MFGQPRTEKVLGEPTTSLSGLKKRLQRRQRQAICSGEWQENEKQRSQTGAGEDVEGKIHVMEIIHWMKLLGEVPALEVFRT